MTYYLGRMIETQILEMLLQMVLYLYIMPIMPHTSVNIIHKMKTKYNEYNVISYFDGAVDCLIIKVEINIEHK